MSVDFKKAIEEKKFNENSSKETQDAIDLVKKALNNDRALMSKVVNKLMENDSYNKWITDFENHSTNVYHKIKQYGSEIIKENAEKHNTTAEKPMALKAALVEPFQRITRYPLLLDTCLKTVKKVVQTNSGYIREKDILERALAVVKRFTESVNDDVRKEEERTLYNKISYNMEIVLGKNPDKVIALLDKPNLRVGVCVSFADYCYNPKFF